MRCVLPGLFALAFLAAGSVAARAEEPGAEGREFFEQRVRPLLVTHCYECHSEQAREDDELRGGLLLDSRAGWQAGGDSGPVIAPGKPDESLIVEAVQYDGAIQMPPSGKLSERDIATLVEWVAIGAPDPRDAAPMATDKKPGIDFAAARQQWPFAPLSKPEPPAVSQTSWCRTPIDRFVLARVEDAGLTPSREADRRKLIRRAYFDLTGLPPTPEEVEAFVNDPSPMAFENLIDDLLASPHYGERWGRYWLDVARFAESHGFEHDYDRPHAYHYRDFVIRAFNADLPFDTFIRWNLAGDEYEPENNLALAATGFLAAGVHSTQITMNQAEKERYDELDDMLATTGSAFLGLTIGCARCHDHKFDPIPQRDYYRLLASLTTTVRSEIEVPLDRDKAGREQEAFEAEHAPYVEAIARYEADELPSQFDAWEAKWPVLRDQFVWRTLELESFESSGEAILERQADGSILAKGNNAEHDTYTLVAAAPAERITAIRLDALSHPSLAHGGPGRAENGNFALTNLRVRVVPPGDESAATPVVFDRAAATFEQDGLPVAAAIDGDEKTGWAVDPQFGRDHAAVFYLAGGLDVAAGSKLSLTIDFKNNKGHNLGRLRLSVASDEGDVPIEGDAIPSRIVALMDTPADQRTGEDRAALVNWYRTIDAPWRSLHAELEAHAAKAPQPEMVTMLISSEGLPAVRLHTQGPDFYENVYILTRGDPNQKQDVASQGFLQVLTSSAVGDDRWAADPPENWRTSYRRTALAEWLTDCEGGAGHQAARVIVNRLWQHHFGRGIVATPNDFGAQGEPPSHPELLDWLAAELIAGGWKLKPIHKLIMRSAVYRQTVGGDEASAQADPDNRLLSRWTPRRLDAEALRDTILATGGRLDPAMFGPGTLDPASRRRSVYFTIKRSELVPMMQLFDAPEALGSVAQRPTTTVAPQALLLLNNEQVRASAAAFAERIDASADESWKPCIDRAYRIALGRAPVDEELEAAVEFLDQQSTTPDTGDPADARRHALTNFCHVLLGLNEFIYIE